MATEQPPVSTNGYVPQAVAGHDYAAQAVNASYAPASTVSATSSTAQGGNEIPKDQVGWYFVEQYYTTLSRSPEKLHLFYNKRSQFVSGLEEDKVAVSTGQKAINERIKEQDWEDAKVRVTNVDSQGSDQNIVIQVIGEISNRSQPHRRFTQTFVLAAQTNGFFVLNDIFRFLRDEEDLEGEEAKMEIAESTGIQEPAPTGVATGAATEETTETVTDEKAVQEVDQKLEEIQKDEEGDAAPPPAAVNGTPIPENSTVVQAEEAPVAAVAVPEQSKPSVTETSPPKTSEQPEKPKEPSHTPVPSAKSAAGTPPAPPKPAVPKTWAGLVAANNKSAVPTAASAAAAAQPAASQPKQPVNAPAAQSAAPSAPAAATAPARQASPANSQGESGWQTAGAENSKRQSRVQPQSSTPESQSNRAYIKNVYESVDADTLKKTLAKYGELAYFDISRQKNCAFVDFATQAGFQAAVAANPHQVGNDTIYVEERRVRPTSFQGNRGGIGGRGRGGFEGRPGSGRGGFNKDGGRGGFTPRGRGNMTPRGRGASQAA